MKNDLIHVQLKDREYLGYFDGLDRAGGTISIEAHDRAKDQGKDGLFRGIGVRYAQNLTKLSVDILGNIYHVAPEPRHELA